MKWYNAHNYGDNIEISRIFDENKIYKIETMILVGMEKGEKCSLESAHTNMCKVAKVFLLHKRKVTHRCPILNKK